MRRISEKQMHFQQITNMAIPGARIPVPGVKKFTVLVYPSLLIITVCSMPRSRDENISMKKIYIFSILKTCYTTFYPRHKDFSHEMHSITKL